jgi:hypothetical protein
MCSNMVTYIFLLSFVRSVQLASPSSRVHVYLPHTDIALVDKLLEFPKKAYALKQNPDASSSFHEGRLIFQRLADQLWPGPVILYSQLHSGAPDALVQRATTSSNTGPVTTQFVGFRCPSHPLSVKVVRQIHTPRSEPMVMVGLPLSRRKTSTEEVLLFKATDVAYQFAQMALPSFPTEYQPKASIHILQGEDKREIFSVPTCEFQDHWLECWIVQESRTVILKGTSQRKLPQLEHLLRTAPTKNRVVQSVMGQWKVVDLRGL